MAREEQDQFSKREIETSNWRKLDQLMKDFYQGIQSFGSLFPPQFFSALGMIDINGEGYTSFPLGEQKTDFGILQAFQLIRFSQISLKPYMFTVRFVSMSPPEVAALNLGWRYTERADGVLFSSVGAKDKRTTRLVQIARPNSFIEMGDSEDNKDLIQELRADIDYRSGRVAGIRLQIGYERSPEKETFNYSPNQPDKKVGFQPSLEELIQALVNIKNNQKAITLKAGQN